MIDLATSVPAEIVQPSVIDRWPAIIAAPPMRQLRPMIVLPAMPTQPATAVCAPMRQLWPIWIWLSSLTSSSMTVSSSAPRSIVVLAPTSQSAPITTRAICGILSHTPSSSAMPKPSAPITAPECTIVRAPIAQRAYTDTCGYRCASAPISTSSASVQPAPTTARAPTRARAPIVTNGPMSAVGSTDASGAMAAVGCRCAVTGGGGCSSVATRAYVA